MSATPWLSRTDPTGWRTLSSRGAPMTPTGVPCAARPSTRYRHFGGPCRCFIGGPAPEFPHGPDGCRAPVAPVPTIRSIVAVAACAVTIACILALVLAGYEPPLSGLTVVGVPLLAGIAGWIARGPRWQS